MHVELEQWNIVIAGVWNVAIFDPPWIGQYVLKGTSLEGQQGVQEVFLDARGPEIRHTIGTLRLKPFPDRFTVGTTSIEDLPLTLMESAAASILKTLRHTPVIGLGINFGFSSSSPPPERFLQKFQINDDEALELICKRSKISSEIKRSFPVENMMCILNHMIGLNDNRVKLQLNFHHDISNADQAVKELEKKPVIPLREIAMKIVTEMYGGLTAEEH
ncbi:MAG: hypothetical protein ACLQPD_07970 [Desulfomonilaceae bacterium]